MAAVPDTCQMVAANIRNIDEMIVSRRLHMAAGGPVVLRRSPGPVVLRRSTGPRAVSRRAGRPGRPPAPQDRRGRPCRVVPDVRCDAWVGQPFGWVFR